jgi:ferritin-like metal-binding protein YciE
MDTMNELLEDELRDLYSAENQLLKALPKMAKKASVPTLKTAFTSHLKQTEGHVERLTKIGEELGMKLGGKKCHAMAGLVEEGGEALKEDEGLVTDAALIGAAQRVEHYEIAAYGTARAMAEHLGLSNAASLLQETLDEEAETDKKLTEISVHDVMPQAPTKESGNGK